MSEYIAEDLYDPCGSLIGVMSHGELIRCKDCKYYEHLSYPTFEHYCHSFGGYIATDENWYCADAKRKEE